MRWLIMLSELPRVVSESACRSHVGSSPAEAGLGAVQHRAENEGDEHVTGSRQHVDDH
jgi:hypothetical protein